MNSVTSWPHNVLSVFVAQDEIMAFVPWGTGTPSNDVSCVASRIVRRTGAKNRSVSLQVAWRSGRRLISALLICVFRCQELIGDRFVRISLRRCCCSVWPRDSMYIAHTMDDSVVSCPAARKVMAWSIRSSSVKWPLWITVDRISTSCVLLMACAVANFTRFSVIISRQTARMRSGVPEKSRLCLRGRLLSSHHGRKELRRNIIRCWRP